MSEAIQIVVNGQPRRVPEGIRVTGLLSHLSLPVDRVAIEHNREILPRLQWSSTAVQPGDCFEIVQLVGGG